MPVDKHRPRVLERGCFSQSGVVGDLEKVQKGFLRSCLGVKRSTPIAVIMKELRRQPLSLCMLRQVLSFAERVWWRDESDLVRVAMKESFALASTSKKGWAYSLMKCLRLHGVVVTDPGLVCGVKCLNMEDMSRQWLASMGEVSHLPADIRSVGDSNRVGFKIKKYLKWFSDSECDVSETFWSCLHRPRDIALVAGFRMGSHSLNVETQRFASGRPVARSQRVCQCCRESEVEDELHIFSCPLYEEVVEDYPYLFERVIPTDISTDAKMNMCMNANGMDDPSRFWRCMAGFLYNCEKARTRALLSG